MERRDNSQEEEGEDVSLCDLPVLSLVKEDEEEKKQRPNDDKNSNKDDDDDDDKAANDVAFDAQEEFAFGDLTGGSLSTPSEMCAAEDIFFRGQILPLRLSVSSEGGTNRVIPTRIYRSESMEHGSLTGFRSISSSRSSSCSSRSTQNSSSITPGTLITITRVTSEPRLRTRNQFSTHPSPKPQIRVSSARGLERVGSAGRKQKSSMWDFFRVGLVRTPEIELQEIKANLRGNNRGNSTNKCTNYSITRDNYNINNNFSTSGENSNNVVEKQKRRKFLSGCRCSVETVASNVIVVNKSKVNNSGTTSTTIIGEHIKGNIVANNNKHGDHKTTSLKMKKNNVYGQSDEKQKQEGSRKQAVSHHRTYEWLKELSHANLPMHI